MKSLKEFTDLNEVMDDDRAAILGSNTGVSINKWVREVTAVDAKLGKDAKQLLKDFESKRLSIQRKLRAKVNKGRPSASPV